mmetsp:Transcript_38588/g.89982  ORF Transcript_38588/g.89982 Transcript_38588/m.89982 type:complete len:206 (+) Transcript_38588:390-1007(+)
MNIASFFIILKRARSKKPLVASLRGNIGTTKSALENSSSTVTKVAPTAAASGFSLGPVYSSSHPKALRRLATAWPILPKPTMPTVDECTSFPHIHRGSHVPQLPSLTAAIASPNRLAVAISSTTVVSAVVSVRQSGVNPSEMDRCLRAAVSTWLYPTLIVLTTFSLPPAASTSSPSILSVRRQRRASHPLLSCSLISSRGIALSL